MARAVCSKCGNSVRWYAGRGRKLTDVRTNCCDAPANAAPAAKGHRADPSLYLEARFGGYKYEHGAEWVSSKPVQIWTASTARIAILADGRIQFGKYYRRYKPSETIVDGWRYFECARTDTHNFYCRFECRAQLREEDYQRLLAKAAVAGAKQTVDRESVTS